MPRPTVTIIGAGLVGALLATLLGQSGHRVRLVEKRADPRRAGFAGGRSINLALAERGLDALRKAGLEAQVLAQAVMMRGRMVHEPNGTTNLQRYGLDDREVIWSVSRGGLNMLLLDAAEQAGARTHFGQALVDADLRTGTLQLQSADGTCRTLESAITIGADGAGSALRAAMAHESDLGERTDMLAHGYKELEIPPGPTEQTRFAIEAHALHIWPRGGYMCIALPNREGSFTVTLFMPHAGAHPSFETVTDATAASALFETSFPDALPLIVDLKRDFQAHPVGMLGTLYLERWHLDGRCLLIGDASHAIVPFHGQGMNAGFEDTVCLARLLAEPNDTGDAFAAFQAQRKPNTDAIAAMALENYVEMRDSVIDPHYLLKRELGRRLAEHAPGHFMSRYRMVSFTRLPYAYARERGRAQDTLLEQLLGKRRQLDGLDMDAAARTLRASLPPLPNLHDECHVLHPPPASDL